MGGSTVEMEVKKDKKRNLKEMNRIHMEKQNDKEAKSTLAHLAKEKFSL